ncbi:MAG TPA: hypothetical protein VJM53_09665 [Burkholderiales bacterium]|jgi:phage terminase Nu1 subunit (DNA packaging protein)|nr:hypothetical protein [Burkholderiales bacterium]
MATEEPVDLQEVARLVQALENDLARLQAGGDDYVALKAEVEALREALHLTDEQKVRERLHGLHRFLDEAADTAFTGSQYIGSIGRMLGM